MMDLQIDDLSLQLLQFHLNYHGIDRIKLLRARLVCGGVQGAHDRRSYEPRVVSISPQ